MSEFSTSAEYPVSAEKLWATVRDFADVGWIPGIEGNVEFKGEGIGMVRIMHGFVHERLESVDDDARVLGYAIDEGNPMPVDGYRATMTVKDLGGDRSELTWACRFEPKDVSEGDAQKAVGDMYAQMLSWVGDYVQSK